MAATAGEALGDTDPTVTRVALSDPGVVMGTVGYMSPEQANGRPVDFKNEEIRRGRLDDAAYWGRRAFLQSGKAANDYFHLILPLLNLRADAETRVLLEEAERTTPIYSRIQRMLTWLELLKGMPIAP